MIDDTTSTVFSACATHRRAVAGLLEGLSAEQLATPSLCAGWDVGTVGAHLADAAAPNALNEFLMDLVRAGGRLHRANDAAARRARGRPVTATVALLRERADSQVAPPVTGARGALTEVLVHEGDMRLPLNLPFEPSHMAVRPALDFVTTGRPIGFVPRGRLRGLRLVAPDMGWSWGEGLELRGAGIDLLMAACGRTAVLPRLEGPGVIRLRSRSRA